MNQQYTEPAVDTETKQTSKTTQTEDQPTCMTTNTEEDNIEKEKRHMKITMTYTYASNIARAGTSSLNEVEGHGK